MSFDAKTTIQDHPVETAAAVIGVALIGVVLFQNRKMRQLQFELELSKIRAELYRQPDYHRLDRHQKRKIQSIIQ